MRPGGGRSINEKPVNIRALFVQAGLKEVQNLLAQVLI